MQIAAFRLRPFVLPLRRPLRTARGTLARREGLLIAVGDGAGGWGIGEAAPLPGFGMESREACGEALARWGRALAGCAVDPAALAAGGLAALPLAEEAARLPAAAHGLETALCDLAARRAGLSLARWLNPDALDAVPVNATLGAEPAEEAARLAAAFVREGYGTLKIKVGADDLETDLARLRAVRGAVGEGIRLRVDANGAWAPEAALRALEAMARFTIEYAEQPVPAEDLAGLAWVARRAPIPVAADEALRSPEEASRVLQARAARVLILKPMVLGGLFPTLAVARQAAARGVPSVITTTIDGVVARTAALHAAAAACALAPGPPPACGLATGAMLARDLVPDPPLPARGFFAVPDGPGLGLGESFSFPFRGRRRSGA